MESLIVRRPRSEDIKTSSNVGFFGSLSNFSLLPSRHLYPTFTKVATYVLPFEKSPPTFSPLANFPDYLTL